MRGARVGRPGGRCLRRLMLAAALAVMCVFTVGGDAQAVPVVDLVLGGQDAHGWNASNLWPGRTGTFTVTLHNAGSKDGKVTIWLSDIVNTEGSNPESETGNIGEPGELGAYLLLGVSGPGLETNVGMPTTLANMPNDPGSASYIRLPRLSAGQTVTLEWEWILPASTGNDVQGDGISLSIHYVLEEILDGGSGGTSSTTTTAPGSGGVPYTTTTTTSGGGVSSTTTTLPGSGGGSSTTTTNGTSGGGTPTATTSPGSGGGTPTATTSPGSGSGTSTATTSPGSGDGSSTTTTTGGLGVGGSLPVVTAPDSSGGPSTATTVTYSNSGVPRTRATAGTASTSTSASQSSLSSTSATARTVTPNPDLSTTASVPLRLPVILLSVILPGGVIVSAFWPRRSIVFLNVRKEMDRADVKPLSIQIQGRHGKLLSFRRDIALHLSTDSATGTFALDKDAPKLLPGSPVMFPAGSSAVGLVYLDSTPGTHKLTARRKRSLRWNTGHHQVTLKPSVGSAQSSPLQNHRQV